MGRLCYYDEDAGFVPYTDEPEPQKPQTNADRIRSMTDEELAELLWNRSIQIVEKAAEVVGFSFKCDREKCLSNVLGWLKQEVEA